MLVCNGADLRDYYYYYQISEERTVRNALSMILDKAEADLLKPFCPEAIGDGPYRPALRSMAMRDLNSVEFGQGAHLSLVFGEL